MVKLLLKRVILSVLVPVLLLPEAPDEKLSESAIRSNPVGAAGAARTLKDGK